MKHRHLQDGHESSAPAIEDVLERGTLADWQDLARRLRADPFGSMPPPCRPFWTIGIYTAPRGSGRTTCPASERRRLTGPTSGLPASALSRRSGSLDPMSSATLGP